MAWPCHSHAAQGEALGHVVADEIDDERALAERWGDPPPAWLAALRRPGRLLWLLLLGLGLPGVLLYGWRSPGHLLFALFVLYFFAALFVIPYKLRFAMPLIPVLCIFSASTVAGALSLRRPR